MNEHDSGNALDMASATEAVDAERPARKKAARKKAASQRVAKKKPAATKGVASKHQAKREHHDVVIIGAGFAGLGTAIRLRQAGVTDLVILERGEEVGGTWRDNRYPGAACDIPSNLYSYSFAPNPAWSRAYSPGEEILQYIHHMVDEFALAPLIHFKRNVSRLTFDEARGVWLIDTAQGQAYEARAVMMSSGPLPNEKYPDIAGIDDFQGKKMHSARWDHQYDFRGKKVAVVGTGASAVQIVPELVKQAASVKVFQRTPGWVLPRGDFKVPGWNKALFRHLPAAQSALRQALYWGHESMALAVIWDTPLTAMLEKIAAAYLRQQVKDPWLRRQLTPQYRIGCKRILMTSDYYPALQQPHCKLITWPIVSMTPDGIRTAEGVDHQFDCVVFATGFEVYNNHTPFPITGRGGRDLNQEWQGGAQAYKSVNVSGYPNLFMTFGPNSGPGHNSALVYMEEQIDYAVKGIQMILARNLKMLDVLEAAQRDYNQRIQKRLTRTNWNAGCKSWYLTEDGFNAAMFPGFATQFARQMREFRIQDYQTV